jgi:hypothetical protein
MIAWFLVYKVLKYQIEQNEKKMKMENTKID